MTKINRKQNKVKPEQQTVSPIKKRRRIKRIRTAISVILLIAAISSIFILVRNAQIEKNNADAAAQKAQAQLNAQEEVDKLKCTKNDVRVELFADNTKFNYENGLTMKVKYSYTGSTSCKMSAGQNDYYYIVTSGPQTIYNSSNCQLAPEDYGFLFGPGDSIEREFKWSLRGAGADGCATGAWQPEGYYHVKLYFKNVDGLESSDGVFAIG